jgi:GlpG protein
MRCLGEIEGRKKTEVFIAYLLTQDISAQIDGTDANRDRWEIWIRDEDKLATAKAHLSDYTRDPHNPKYSAAIDAAGKILADKEKQRQQAARNVKRVEVRSARSGGGSLPPLTLTLLILSIVISLATGLGRPRTEWAMTINEQLRFVSAADYNASQGVPAASLRKGEVWRSITPIFLHLDIIHLAMNMFVLVSFGRMVERWLGTPQFALFVLLLAIGPNLFQGLSPDWLRGSPFFGGMSGVLYGLFGYTWVRSTLNPNLGVVIPLPIAFIFVGLIVLGLVGVFPTLAHLAHLGGLLIGSAMGFAAERRRR